MEASVRNEEDMFVVRGCCEFCDVGEQFLSARHVEFSTGQHEVGLRVHFPQNQIERYHAISVKQLVVRSSSLYSLSEG
jgi:hypothetical protein